jgi:hypothetical protein
MKASSTTRLVPLFLTLLAFAPVGCGTKSGTSGSPSASAPTASASASAKVPEAPRTAPQDDRTEGCPCGCDHSEAMAAELRARGGDHAGGAIDEALATIAARERAGYVTEAMVLHRLRLLDLARDLGHTPALAPSSTPLAAAPSVEDATLRVRAQLIVHGEHTEVVDGREKLLRAAFVLRMEIENKTDADLTLAQPAIAAAVPFPVSRWYLAGGDGRPWNGALAAREARAVNVIGYLDGGVTPDTTVAAVIELESLSLAATTRARRRWDEPL